VALHELDGDGLSNDVVYVDVRSDEVVVAPVPGTETRSIRRSISSCRCCCGSRRWPYENRAIREKTAGATRT